MKNGFRFWLIGTAFVLLSSQPIAAQSGDAAIPTYTETDISAKAALTRPWMTLKTTDDGLLVVLDTVNKVTKLKYLDSSGATVKSFPVDPAEYYAALCVDPSGNTCLFAWDLKNKSEPIAIWRVVLYSPDGKKIKTVNLGERDFDPMYVKDFALDAKGAIYVATIRGVEVYDSQGKQRRKLVTYAAQGLDVDLEGKLYVIGYSMEDNKGFLDKIDPASGKQLWRIELGEMPLALRLNRKANTISLMDERFVTAYSTEGKQIARVFDVGRSSIVGRHGYNASFTTDPTGNLYFILRKPDAKASDPLAYAFYRYTRSTQAVEIKKTLTISHGYAYDRFLDLAINTFRKANPGWTVEFGRRAEAFATKESREQVLSSIITELMAGKGADVIALSEMPYRTFTDRGLLVNLDQMAASDKTFPAAELRQNVLNAFRYKGGLYALPTVFIRWAIFASSKVLTEARVSISDTTWTWMDFFAVADKVRKDTNGDGVVDRFALPSIDASELFHWHVLPCVLDSYYSSEKRQASFTNLRFVELLKATKSFAERNAEKNPFDYADWFLEVEKGNIVFYRSFLLGVPTDPDGYRQLFGLDAQILSLPSDGDGDQASSSCLFGINQSSRSAQKAWEFLKLMVSEQLQQDPNLFGFPINAVAYSKKVQAYKDAKDAFRSGDPRDSFTDKDIALENNFLARIKRSEYIDSRLSSIITAELKGFFASTRSAEDACRALQQKVMTYLQE